jgi:hypothetical protein
MATPMPQVNEEPAMSFWLAYAEGEGALVEDRGDHALVLLTDPLQEESELPDEVTVTSHPDIAREDGAVLLIAGHPAVERAAGLVLAEGDTGSAHLPWPASRPPSRSTLESRARELVSIEHGRIDAAGEPIAAYLPLLRVGAMVSYAASLTLRFQEQEEVWVDARTGLAPSERLLSGLRDRTRLARPDGHGRKLEADLSLAISAAHEQLEHRAFAREGSLVAHARRALDSELARADAYYEATLESIARRRATAPADRARLLDAQAEATRAERARRRREIEDEYSPRHEIRPFRLHLVHLPAFVLPVDVRRGSRAFRFELTWAATAGEFVSVRCPACGAAEPLVATRERLSCRACTASTTARNPGVAAAPTTAVKPPPASPTLPVPVAADAERPAARRSPAGEEPQRPQSALQERSGRDRPRKRTQAAARPRAGATGGPLRARGLTPGDTERTGNKLAFAFWQCVANGERWPRQKAARDSPLRAVYRLYGNAGPQCAIGVPPNHYVDEMTASTYPAEPRAPALTMGSVTAHGETYRYAMVWSIQAGKPVVGEVMPAPHPLVLPPVHGADAELARRLRERAPAPTVELDPVSSTLWDTERKQSGLPFAVRCLATWWRVQGNVDPSSPATAVAAAVASAVARAAEIRRTRAATATTYKTDISLVESVEHELKAELRLDRGRGW